MHIKTLGNGLRSWQHAGHWFLFFGVLIFEGMTFVFFLKGSVPCLDVLEISLLFKGWMRRKWGIHSHPIQMATAIVHLIPGLWNLQMSDSARCLASLALIFSVRNGNNRKTCTTGWKTAQPIQRTQMPQMKEDNSVRSFLSLAIYIPPVFYYKKISRVKRCEGDAACVEHCLWIN